MNEDHSAYARDVLALHGAELLPFDGFGPPIACKAMTGDAALYARHEHHLGAVNMLTGTWDGTDRYCDAVLWTDMPETWVF